MTDYQQCSKTEQLQEISPFQQGMHDFKNAKM
jgi:hypothetical protein